MAGGGVVVGAKTTIKNNSESVSLSDYISIWDIRKIAKILHKTSTARFKTFLNTSL